MNELIKYIQVWRVAKKLDVSKRYIYDLIRQGILVAVKLGPRAIRIEEESLNRFIEERKLEPSELEDFNH